MFFVRLRISPIPCWAPPLSPIPSRARGARGPHKHVFTLVPRRPWIALELAAPRGFKFQESRTPPP
eukprot:1440152-Pyramimonas_sp.AAC.1